MFVNTVIKRCDCQARERTHTGARHCLCRQCGKCLRGSGPFAPVKRFIDEIILSCLSTVVKASAAQAERNSVL